MLELQRAAMVDQKISLHPKVSNQVENSRAEEILFQITTGAAKNRGRRDIQACKAEGHGRKGF